MKTIKKPMLSFLFNIVLPFILCLLVTYMLSLKIITSAPAYLMPLGFGIVIGVFNFKKYIYKIYFLNVLQVVLICITISYFCFYFSLLLFPLISIFIEYVLEFFGINLYHDRYNFLFIPVTVYFIAPYSLFFANKLIFYFPKTNFTKVTILFFLLLFPTLGFILETVDTSEPLQTLLWMPLVILPIQLILNQKEIIEIFKAS
jgi:hypothetical protein